MIKKILIIDDSVIAREMLKSCIPGDREYRIFEASNGEEGVQMYMEISPDVTFIDLTMPIMSGFNAIPLIKNVNLDAVIIVLTADIQQKNIEYVMSLGAFSVVRKPANSRSVTDVIDKAENRLAQLAGEKNDGKKDA